MLGRARMKVAEQWRCAEEAGLDVEEGGWCGSAEGARRGLREGEKEESERQRRK